MEYPGHSLREGLTPPQRYSRCILQPQPTGLRWFIVIFMTLVGGRGGLTPLQRYSRCILLPQPTGLTWFLFSIRTLVRGWGSYPSADRQSVYSTALGSKSVLFDSLFFFWWGGGICGFSTLVGYLMPNPVYTYILNTYYF